MKALWLSGIHPVREILDTRPESVLEIMIAREGSIVDDILNKARTHYIPIRKIPPEELHKLIGYHTHQGIAAKLESFQYMTLDAFFSLHYVNQAHKRLGLILLDCLQDPQNFGSILRSAVFFGIDGVVIPKYRSVSVTPAVAKVSSGALGRIPIIQVKNLVKAIDAIKEMGITVIGLDAHTNKTLYEMDMTEPVAIIIGNEHSGLRRQIRKVCDLLAAIPRIGPMESLNAAISAAVACSELQRQRITNLGSYVPQKGQYPPES